MKKITVCLLILFSLLAVPHKTEAAFPIFGPVSPEAQAPIVTAADTTPDDPTTGPLRVVTRVVPPFVVDKADDPNSLCADSPMMTGDNNKKFCGYSQELLKVVAEKMGREVASQALDKTADDVVEDMSGKNPKYDIAIGNMSITSAREEQVDFSIPLPITNSGIQIMTRAPDAQNANFIGNAWRAVSGQTARQVYPFLGLIVLLMVITATAVYLIERRHKNSFLHNESWIKGIAEAFWWILTTIFGQEESHPKGLSSRIIAFLWIPFGVICVSLFTATVTASLTAQQIQNTINSLDDLRGKSVLTVAGSTSKKYLDDHSIKAEVVGTISAAYPQLENGKYDAIVYDAPALQYYADHQGKDKVVTVGKLLKRESYGLVFPAGSPLREQVNQALLQMQDEGIIDRLNQKWFEEK
jgi:polar amino acid transport system substrate-binding protein